MKSFSLNLLIQLLYIAHVHAFAPNYNHAHVSRSGIDKIATQSRNHVKSHASTFASNTKQAKSFTLNLKDENMTEEERAIAVEKATKQMTAFSNKYMANTDTKYCTDKSIPSVVIKGLAEHKVSLGTPLCPCRYYEDKEKEAKSGFWNCPCVPMRERHECHCMLFLTEDNAFAGEETNLTFEEVVENSN